MSRSAIITGASSGIGRAIALYFATKAVSIVLVGRNEERLQEVRHEILRVGGAAEIFPADIGEEAHAKQIVEGCVRAFGRVDILVNNAGVGHYHPFPQMTADAYSRVIKTNLLGALHLTSHTLPLMIERGTGSVVNVSSVGAMIGIPCRSIYCATKAALRSWSRSLFLEMRPYGVHVLSVLPANTATRFFDNLLGDPPAAHVMPGSLMRPERVAELIWKGLEARKREIVIGPFGKLVDIANRMSPAFMDILVDFQHRRTAGRSIQDGRHFRKT